MADSTSKVKPPTINIPLEKRYLEDSCLGGIPEGRAFRGGGNLMKTRQPSEDKEGNPRSNGFVEAAHDAGLAVHPYTVRKDGLPGFCGSIDELHSLLLRDLRVDGFFTDFPDLSRLAVDHHTPKR